MDGGWRVPGLARPYRSCACRALWQPQSKRSPEPRVFLDGRCAVWSSVTAQQQMGKLQGPGQRRRDSHRSALRHWWHRTCASGPAFGGVVAGGAQHSVTVPLNAFLSKERCGDAACSATRCRRRCWAGECCWGLTAAIAALPQLRQSCRLPLTARSAQTVYGGPERFSAASPGSKLRIKCNPKPADCSASVVSAALCGCSSCNGPWPNPPAC